MADSAAPQQGSVTVVSGPTAVGKGTVCARLRDVRPDVFLSVSATTRPPRPGEVDGVHYHFLDDAEFDRLIETGQMLEWADRKSTRLNSSHVSISYAVFCLK